MDVTLTESERLPVINRVNMEMKRKSQGIYVFNKWGLANWLDVTLGGRMEKLNTMVTEKMHQM